MNATTHKHAKLHQSQLPAPPRTWPEMLRHPNSINFLAAAKVEYEELLAKGTFTAVREEESKGFVIPLMWVFSYKGDEGAISLNTRPGSSSEEIYNKIKPKTRMQLR